jgi:hypothetical protein
VHGCGPHVHHATGPIKGFYSALTAGLFVYWAAAVGVVQRGQLDRAGLHVGVDESMPSVAAACGNGARPSIESQNGPDRPLIVLLRLVTRTAKGQATKERRPRRERI